MRRVKTLDSDQIAKFLNWFLDYRNKCMALIMLDAGLRVGELVRLRMGDLYCGGFPVNQLTVRAEISKTKTERTIPVSPRLSAAIMVLKEKVWFAGPWLCSHYAFYVHDAREHITVRQVERIIKGAGIVSLGVPVTPHTLRHTFGSRVLRKSNLRVAQELLGHRRVTSTQIYTHPNADDKRTAVDAISQPEPKGVESA